MCVHRAQAPGSPPAAPGNTEPALLSAAAHPSRHRRWQQISFIQIKDARLLPGRSLHPTESGLFPACSLQSSPLRGARLPGLLCSPHSPGGSPVPLPFSPALQEQLHQLICLWLNKFLAKATYKELAGLEL